MPSPRARYIPALGFRRLTSLYDPALRWTMNEAVFKSRLIEQAGIEPGHRVLDLGCGTGTLTILAQERNPQAEVVGTDGDRDVLLIARSKAASAGRCPRFDQAMCSELPYADQAFDRVISSLLFHHLAREDKRRTLGEVIRVLRHGGELHVVDWGKPRTMAARAGFLLVRLLDGFATTEDSARGLLSELFREAGFRDVRERGYHSTMIGTLTHCSARRP